MMAAVLLVNPRTSNVCSRKDEFSVVVEGILVVVAHRSVSVNDTNLI